MQIIVNTRLLLKNRLDGIGWFSYQTLRRITHNNPNVHFVFLFDRPFDNEFVFSDNVTPLILNPQARHPVLYFTWFQFVVKPLLNKMKPDLFLSPDGFLALGTQCRQLPVIHDINFLHHPKDSKWLTSKYYNFFFPRFAKAAERIATVSEFSKQDIVKNYGIAPDKIDVVYNGIHSFFKPLSEDEKIRARQKFSYGKNYFINIGSLHPRKNIVNLVKAFSLFKEETRSDMKLLLAGPGFWGLSDIRKAIEESSVKQDIVFTERLSDPDLALALGASLALTFVPYYEGFGIPLIEAMQAEIPIITSNVTSLPEVAGNAALLAKPTDIHSIKSAMVRLYKDEALRKDLVERGRLRKREFSWDRSADLLWQSILKATS